MKHRRWSRILVALGATLMVAAIGVPWLTLISIWGRPPDQVVSPASILWYTLTE